MEQQPSVVAAVQQVDAAVDVSTVDGARAALGAAAAHGWDTPEGTALLVYARDRIVRPAVRRAGLRGPDADQAAATGWAVAWEALRTVRGTTRSPWGVVTVAVRRAVLGEALAAAYVTSARAAWRIRADSHAAPRGGDGLADRPVPWVVLPGGDAAAAQPSVSLGPALDAVTDALVEQGWTRDDVHALVDWAVARLSRPGRASTGWRALAMRCGLPAWRVRRALCLLVGDDDWPGLVERASQEGLDVLGRPESRAAMRSTVHPRSLPPAAAAQRAALRTRDEHRCAS